MGRGGTGLCLSVYPVLSTAGVQHGYVNEFKELASSRSETGQDMAATAPGESNVDFLETRRTGLSNL